LLDPPYLWFNVGWGKFAWTDFGFASGSQRMPTHHPTKNVNGSRFVQVKTTPQIISEHKPHPK